MSRLDDMTTALFGNERVEVTASAASSETYTITGHATSSSAEGTVWVNLSDDVTHGDNEPEDDSELGTSVEMSTTVNVLDGDEVIVTVYGGVISSMVVTGVVGRGDEQDDKINDAQRAAQAAWDWADESHDAAVQAQRDADAAEAAAGAAQQSADAAAADAASAAASAQTANENALQAIEDASAASDAAQAAQGSADSAAQSARTAQQTAEAAQQSANTAQSAANAAQTSANAANAHAIAALNSLSTVEDVVDTLTWITEHGTMAKTADTAVDPSKVYFVRDNDGDYSVGGNRYSIVHEPAASGLSSYYELTIDKSVENYIATHLSVTNEGLWLTPMESDGYRVLVATGGSGKTYPTAGTYIIDGSGVTVAQFTGTGISFADDRTFYIGDSDAYIFFDGNGHINIGGSNVTIGGSTTLAELLAKYDATITSDDISVSKTGGTATITVGGDTVTISDGATGAQGPKGDTGDQGPQGPKGNDGTSVTVSKVEYGTSASASTQPSSWSETVPTSVTKGRWLWVRTTYSDSTTAITKSYVGTNGTDGGRWYAGTKITGTSTTATVFSGSGITAAVVGDMYLNTSTYNTYRCTVAGNASTAKWVYTANIKGQTGSQGPQGETGSAGTNGVSITGVEHQYYLSTSSTSQTGGSWTVKPAAYVRGRYYWERWKVSFSSGDPTYTTATLAEEVTSAWTAIESNEDSIALKANSSDVYTKTDVDGKITQEATARDAAITAKANEINLSVTEKVYQGAQPNLAPLGTVDFSDKYNAADNPSGYWRATIGAWFTRLDDGWVRVYADNTSGTSAMNSTSWRPSPSPSVVAGGVYTILTEIRNNHSSGSSQTDMYLQQIANNQFWGDINGTTIDDEHVTTTTNISLRTCGETYERYSYRIADTEHLTTTPIEMFRYNFRLPAGGKFDFEFRQSVYEGIYDGPYKPYSGAQLYASQAELKVTNDSISTKVDKNGVISSINQSAESVTINASKINLVGAVTIGDLASDTQDAVLNSNISVGGRNLLTWTGDWSGWVDHLDEWVFSGDVATSAVKSSLQWGDLDSNGIPLEDCYGKTFTLSFDYRSDGWNDSSGARGVYINLKTQVDGLATASRKKYRRIDGGLYVPTNEWQRVVITFTVGNDESWFTSGTAGGSHMAVQFYNYSLNQLQLRHVQLEAGNTATDWTPAPEDVDAAVSDAAKTATNYIVADSSGIKIADANPASSTTYQHQTSSGTDFVVNGGVRNRVNADGMTLYDGNGVADSNIFAKFASQLIELGRNSINSIIKLCNGVGKISVETGTTTTMRIEAESTSEINAHTYISKSALDLAQAYGAAIGGFIFKDSISTANRLSYATVTARDTGQVEIDTQRDDGSTQHLQFDDSGLAINSTKGIKGFNFGYAAAVTNTNGIVTFNPGMGVKPTAVFVTHALAPKETNDVAKLAVPFVWAIDSATQVQVRWKRTDTNDYLRNNTIGYYWLAIY